MNLNAVDISNVNRGNLVEKKILKLPSLMLNFKPKNRHTLCFYNIMLIKKNM